MPPTANSGLTWMASGSDSNLYFTENTANQIGQFKPDRSYVCHVALIPTANSGPTIITGGPDGNIYFIETNANKIGEVVISTPTPPPPPPPPPPGNCTGGGVVISPKIQTTTQLTVAPNPSIVGQAVTLIATVTILQAATVTGTVTFFIDGQAQPPVHLVPQNNVAHATLSTETVRRRPISSRQSYNGNSTLASSGSNAVSLVVAPAPGDGPTVVHLARFGFHSLRTRLVLTFDKPLNPATARDPRNYKISDSLGHRVHIARVVYNPSALTVTSHSGAAPQLAPALSAHRHWHRPQPGSQTLPAICWTGP